MFGLVSEPKLDLKLFSKLKLKPIYCLLNCVPVISHFKVIWKDFAADCAGGRLRVVNVPLVEIQTLLAGQLGPTNVAVVEELEGAIQ